MSNTITLILWIAWTIGLWIFYHRIFTVFYFNLFNGLLKEVIGIALLGLLMTGITLYLWWLSAIIIVIIGLSISGEKRNKGIFIASVVLAIVIAIIGINFKKGMKDDKNEKIIESEEIVENTTEQDVASDVLDNWERLPEGNPYIFKYDSIDYHVTAELIPKNGWSFFLHINGTDLNDNHSVFDVNATMEAVQDENGSYYGTNGVYYRGNDTNNYCTIYAETDYLTKYCKIRLDKYDIDAVFDYIYVEYPQEKDGVDDGIADLEEFDPWDFFGDRENIGKVFRCNCIYEGKEDGNLIFRSHINGGYSDFLHSFYVKADKDYGSFFSGDSFIITAIWKDFEVGNKYIIELVDLQSDGIWNTEREEQEKGIYTNWNQTEIDYLQWETVYQRNSGPASSICIDAIDEDGVVFTASIGASGYSAYVDMRELCAEWTDEYTALYEDDSGYVLSIVLNNDGTLYLSDNQPYAGTLSLSGLYVNELEANFPNCEFVFIDSSYNYISYERYSNLTELECKIARNEIYARHGRKFADESLQAYFDACSWYEGIIEAGDFSENVLNEYELENLSRITEYEENMGYR